MRTHLQSGGRYPVLRAIGIIYVVMAGISIVGGLIAAGYILAAQPWSMTTRVVWSIVSLAGTCFAVLGMLAIAEVLKLFMDIEHSTRMHSMQHAAQPMSMASTSMESAAEMPMGIGTMPGNDNKVRVNRMRELDEETAEGALLRGH